MKSKNTFPKLIGKGLAHLQDFADRLIATGAGKLKEASAEKPKKGEGEAKKVLRFVAKGIGETLETFYDEYTRLKKKRK